MALLLTSSAATVLQLLCSNTCLCTTYSVACNGGMHSQQTPAAGNVTAQVAGKLLQLQHLNAARRWSQSEI
jgi:hypothetical protein